MTRRLTRRRALRAGAAGLAGLLSGCVTVVRESAPEPVGGGEPPTRERTTFEGDHRFPEDVREQAQATGTTVQESVVLVREAGGHTGGTGWVLDDGRVVTNAHVVAGATEFTLETFDGETASATREGYHEDLRPDVGLLSTDLSDVPALSTGSSSTLDEGDPVVQVGHPATVGQWVISLGRFVRREPRLDWLLSDVPTRRGNSGSPLVTLDGAVVGVTSGSTQLGANQTVSRPTTVYESFPESSALTASVPVETVDESVARW
ncbi:S1C family serine protease [Halobacteriaceae archaeon GCM10025711]